jgi:hypothetical protein
MNNVMNMRRSHPAVKVIAASGVRPPEAIRAALGETFQAFAVRNGFARSAVSMCVHGRQRHERVRMALAEELGVERLWLDELLDGDIRGARGR